MRFLLWFGSILVFIAALFLLPMSRDFIIKKTIENFTKSEYLQVQIEDLKSNHKQINIKNARIIMRDNLVAILDNIQVTFSIRDIWRKKEFTIHLDLQDDGTIFGEKTSLLAQIDYVAKSLKHQHLIAQIDKISSPILKKFSMGDLSGNCKVIWVEKDIYVDKCYIEDDVSDFMIGLSGEFDRESAKSLALSGKIKELPEDLHKELHKLLPQNEVLDYLNETISGSLIKDSSWDVYFPAEFFKTFKVKPEYIAGNLNIEKLNYKYDPDFPPLKDIKANLNMLGSHLDFKIISAYSNETKLSDGKVFLDWHKGNDSEVIVDIKSSGPISNLADFIPKEDLESLKKSDIDLTQFKGTAKGDVYIEIPVSETKPNKYNIKVKLENAGLSIFGDAVILSKGNMDGSFDGNIVKIKGKGEANGFNSDIEFINYLDASGPFDTKLDVRSKLGKRNLGEKIPLFNINNGDTRLDITYKDKGGRKYFLAKSDLTNITLNISRLGIYKEAGKKSNLLIEGASKDTKGPLPLKVSIKGEDLEVEGITSLSADITEIHFPKIKSNDTQFKADLEIKPDIFEASIYGKFIDLSKSNMIEFLAKDASNVGSNIKIKFDAIKLKDEIYLDNFMLDVECGRDSCSKGEMFANIGTREFTMNLVPGKDYEEWQIASTNAGAILRGFGIIDNIKAGNIFLNIKTNIKKAERGKIIPIAEGEMKLEKFVTVDNKFLTRLISNLSLPGLMNIIKNSNDISFVEMTSKFDYVNNIINIYEGQANGAYMDLTIKGSIDTENKKIKIKGRVTPPLYGVNSIFNKIPILGNLFGGKGKSGILSAPYTIEDEY